MRITMILTLALCAAAPRAVANPAARHGIKDAFGAALCAGGTRDLRRMAWESGVFDAQVEGRYLEKVASMTVSSKDAERKARTLARVHKFGSYAFGTCTNGDAWAVAFPAPKGLDAADTKGRVKLPIADLQDRCASFRVDFAPHKAGQPRPLAVNNGQVNTTSQDAGTLSITCQPKTPRWQGPVLWYLQPVGDGPDASVPEADALAQAKEPATALATWINRVRVLEGLQPVEMLPALADQASTLAVDGGLVHDRQLLKKSEAALKVAEINFLGEDRVRAATVTDMAWLLWNSPRHRSLLLTKDATAAGIGLRSVGTETLAVILMGAKAPLTTAAGLPGKKGG